MQGVRWELDGLPFCGEGTGDHSKLQAYFILNRRNIKKQKKKNINEENNLLIIIICILVKYNLFTNNSTMNKVQSNSRSFLQNFSRDLGKNCRSEKEKDKNHLVQDLVSMVDRVE